MARQLLHFLARMSLGGFVSLVFLLTACQRNPVTAPVPGSTGVAVFTASKYSIHRGESSVLSWSCINARNVSISEIGAVAASGAYPVHPVVTTTYVLTAQLASGTVTRTVTITVH